jgi:ATP-dependent Clp endopeptidase proteolytic subunit ClpP
MKVVSISGTIGWDVSPNDVRTAINEAGGESLDVQISSPGGFVLEGLEIYNLIHNYPGEKTTHLMGAAASMASYIALAGDKVRAEANTVYMIHNALGGAYGNAADLRKAADIYEGFSNLIAAAYVAKTGKSMDEIKALMDAESWFFGPEAKEAGFVDEIIGETTQDKTAAIAQTRAAYAVATEIVRKLTTTSDLSRIAAFIPTKPRAVLPAVAGASHKEEVHIVNLSEFLAQGSAAVAEIEKVKADAVAPVNARITKCSGYLRSEAYSKSAVIRAKALDAIEGKVSIDALDGAVGAFDMQVEHDKQNLAAGEQATQGATPAQTVTGSQAEAAEIKATADAIASFWPKAKENA